MLCLGPWGGDETARIHCVARRRAAAWPLAARAAQSDQMHRIGVLMGFAESDPTAQSWIAAFQTALAKLGWTEGNNLRIELRWAAADPDKIRSFAKELVDLRPDAIFDQTTPVTGALASETQTIPIVSYTSPIQSAAASPQVLRRQAATSLASLISNRQRAANGSGYFGANFARRASSYNFAPIPNAICGAPEALSFNQWRS
jgi:ABC transporter substrate binding protein